MSHRPSRYAAAVLLLLTGAMTACGGPPNGTGPPGGTAAPPATRPATGHVVVTGVPQAGVEASCVLLDRYLLVAGTPSQRALLEASTAAGTTVTVSGHTDPTQVSSCQQGTLLVVDDLRAGA